MNDQWRRKHAQAHARYSNLKDACDRCDGASPRFEELNRALEIAEKILRKLNRQFDQTLMAHEIEGENP